MSGSGAAASWAKHQCKQGVGACGGGQPARRLFSKRPRRWRAHDLGSAHPRPVRVLSGHQGEVRGLTFTPDSRYLVSGGYDETVRIWNTENGLEEKRLQGYLRWANRLDFGPDGQYLAGTTLTGTVYLWRGHDLGTLHILRGHKSAVRAVAFSPDSQLLVTGGDDSCVSLWDVRSGVRRHALHGHELFVRAVAFDRSGRYLASGSHDNTIRLWDVASGRLLRVISHASASIMHAMAFSPATIC